MRFVDILSKQTESSLIVPLVLSNKISKSQNLVTAIKGIKTDIKGEKLKVNSYTYVMGYMNNMYLDIINSKVNFTEELTLKFGGGTEVLHVGDVEYYNIGTYIFEFLKLFNKLLDGALLEVIGDNIVLSTKYFSRHKGHISIVEFIEDIYATYQIDSNSVSTKFLSSHMLREQFISTHWWNDLGKHMNPKAEIPQEDVVINKAILSEVFDKCFLDAVSSSTKLQLSAGLDTTETILWFKIPNVIIIKNYGEGNAKGPGADIYLKYKYKITGIYMDITETSEKKQQAKEFSRIDASTIENSEYRGNYNTQGNLTKKDLQDLNALASCFGKNIRVTEQVANTLFQEMHYMSLMEKYKKDLNNIGIERPNIEFTKSGEDEKMYKLVTSSFTTKGISFMSPLNENKDVKDIMSHYFEIEDGKPKGFSSETYSFKALLTFPGLFRKFINLAIRDKVSLKYINIFKIGGVCVSLEEGKEISLKALIETYKAFNIVDNQSYKFTSEYLKSKDEISKELNLPFIEPYLLTDNDILEKLADITDSSLNEINSDFLIKEIYSLAAPTSLNSHIVVNKELKDLKGPSTQGSFPATGELNGRDNALADSTIMDMAKYKNNYDVIGIPLTEYSTMKSSVAPCTSESRNELLYLYEELKSEKIQDSAILMLSEVNKESIFSELNKEFYTVENSTGDMGKPGAYRVYNTDCLLKHSLLRTALTILQVTIFKKLSPNYSEYDSEELNAELLSTYFYDVYRVMLELFFNPYTKYNTFIEGLNGILDLNVPEKVEYNQIIKDELLTTAYTYMDEYSPKVFTKGFRLFLSKVGTIDSDWANKLNGVIPEKYKDDITEINRYNNFKLIFNNLLNRVPKVGFVPMEYKDTYLNHFMEIEGVPIQSGEDSIYATRDSNVDMTSYAGDIRISTKIMNKEYTHSNSIEEAMKTPVFQKAKSTISSLASSLQIPSFKSEVFLGEHIIVRDTILLALEGLIKQMDYLMYTINDVYEYDYRVQISNKKFENYAIHIPEDNPLSVVTNDIYKKIALPIKGYTPLFTYIYKITKLFNTRTPDTFNTKPNIIGAIIEANLKGIAGFTLTKPSKFDFSVSEDTVEDRLYKSLFGLVDSYRRDEDDMSIYYDTTLSELKKLHYNDVSILSLNPVIQSIVRTLTKRYIQGTINLHDELKDFVETVVGRLEGNSPLYELADKCTHKSTLSVEEGIRIKYIMDRYLTITVNEKNLKCIDSIPIVTRMFCKREDGKLDVANFVIDGVGTWLSDVPGARPLLFKEDLEKENVSFGNMFDKFDRFKEEDYLNSGIDLEYYKNVLAEGKFLADILDKEELIVISSIVNGIWRLTDDTFKYN